MWYFSNAIFGNPTYLSAAPVTQAATVMNSWVGCLDILLFALLME